MAHRIKDKDGNSYDVLTQEEAEGHTGEPLTFSSEAEALAFVEKLTATPEGEAQLRDLLNTLDEQQQTTRRH